MVGPYARGRRAGSPTTGLRARGLCESLRTGLFTGMLCLIGLASPITQAQQKSAGSNLGARPASAASTEQGPPWASLKPAQREALKPLEREWPGIDGLRKTKWLEIAERFPSLPPQDQQRMQTRMADWAKLTPIERSQVRLNYQEAKQTPAPDRQASWEAYQALSLEQRRELADRAAPAAASAIRTGQAPAKNTRPAGQDERIKGPQPKSNSVPETALTAQPKPVAPIIVRAQPGATTTLISKQPTPPAHQPTGLPKIAATAEFVDSKTLLPQTGPQSTAPRLEAASMPSSRP